MNEPKFNIEEQIKEFQEDAMSGDYDHALQTCMKWVNVV